MHIRGLGTNSEEILTVLCRGIQIVDCCPYVTIAYVDRRSANYSLMTAFKHAECSCYSMFKAGGRRLPTGSVDSLNGELPHEQTAHST